MVAIDMTRIALHDVYGVRQVNASTYVFSTDADVVVAVKFKEDFLIHNDESYEFVISNVNNKKSPLDKKLQRTIIAIIHEFLLCNAGCILYLCETSDSKQRARNRLFESWFKSFDGKRDFVLLQTVITDMEGIENYAAVITRIDNPRLSQVMAEFSETVQALRNKPE